MLSPAPPSIRFVLVEGLPWTLWFQWVCPWWLPVWSALPSSALFPALADFNGCVLGGSQYSLHCLALHSFQLWQICAIVVRPSPVKDTEHHTSAQQEEVALFNTLCSHNLQDAQTFLALQCSSFHMLSVGQHHVAASESPLLYRV